MVQSFDAGEGGLEPVPLRRVLGVAFGVGYGIREGCGGGPEAEFGHWGAELVGCFSRKREYENVDVKLGAGVASYSGSRKIDP